MGRPHPVSLDGGGGSPHTHRWTLPRPRRRRRDAVSSGTQPQAVLSGTGINLGGDDVRALREASRAKALRRAAELPRPDVGEAYFVTPPVLEGGLLRAEGLVTSKAGFHPAHPFHTGSGDHVKAAQFLDCALQLAGFALGGKDLGERCGSGVANFARFVELDIPFATQTSVRAEPSVRHLPSWVGTTATSR